LIAVASCPAGATLNKQLHVCVDRSLWLDLRHYGSVRIDLVVIFLLAVVVPLVWWLVAVRSRGVELPQEEPLRNGAGAILTVNAFLLPLTLLAAPFVAASNPGVAGGTPRITTVDLFITVLWLALSTFFGVGVVAIMTFAKTAPAIWRSLFFWLQVTFLVAGLLRLVLAFGNLTEFVLRKFG
jgi:hypothetical protein